MLQGEMHVIRVGGDSYKEKKNRALIYEDAVLAVKSSIQHGVMLGGNVSICHAIYYHKEEIINDIIKAIYSETRNIMINMTETKIRKAVNDVLMVIADESLTAFRAVFDNASDDKKFKRNIFKTIKHSKSCLTFNLLKNKFEGFISDKGERLYDDRVIIPVVKGEKLYDDVEDIFPDLISPGNMDKEILRATFSILGLFLTSNQLITVHVKRDNKV
jgi:hypothetical protein